MRDLPSLIGSPQSSHSLSLKRFGHPRAAFLRISAVNSSVSPFRSQAPRTSNGRMQQCGNPETVRAARDSAKPPCDHTPREPHVEVTSKNVADKSHLLSLLALLRS